MLTHQPGRTEKYFCSLASGKWILHPSYIDACLEKNSFLPVSKIVQKNCIFLSIYVITFCSKFLKFEEIYNRYYHSVLHDRIQEKR